jgi:hypothetical protein
MRAYCSRLYNLIAGVARMRHPYMGRFKLLREACTVYHYETVHNMVLTDFVPYMPGKDRSLGGDSLPYGPLGYGYIRKMLRAVSMGAGDVFVDIGCGKGRVVCCAALEKIGKVIGIEHDEDLATITGKNLENMKPRPRTPAEVHLADAALCDYSEGTVFYMNAPFGPATLNAVLANIKKGLAAHPRCICILYVCPKGAANYRHCMDNADWLTEKGRIGNTGIMIWKNKGYASF